MRFKILIALSTMLTLTVHAAETEAIFGPEFTFTFDGSVPADVQTAYVNHLREHLTINQPPGAVFSEQFLEFTSPNGWSFKLGADPGVVEISMEPMTAAKYRQFQSDIQDAIFVSAELVGLRPWDFLGGGHINFDAGVFGGDIRFARNFVVDFFSHNELSMGVFGYDFGNATPLQLYDNEVILGVREVVRQADEGFFDDTDDPVRHFFEAVHSKFNYGANLLGQRVGRNTALHLSNFPRIELRAVRPQASMDVWVKQISLLQGRIDYLRGITYPIAFRTKAPLKENLNLEDDDPKSHIFNPPIDPTKALHAFHIYVIQSGQEWKDHRDYIWPAWRKNGILKGYERSREFQRLESCETKVTHVE